MKNIFLNKVNAGLVGAALLLGLSTSCSDDHFDVVVSDGFAGNVLLKTVEGTVKFTTGLMKDAMMSNLKSKIGALLCKKSIDKIKNNLEVQDD